MDIIKKLQDFHLVSAIDAEAQAALLHSNPRLEHALANSAAKGLPPISVLPLAGKHLTILAQLMGAKTVLEVGTLGGYSSICFAEAGARVTSIEINAEHRDVALENVQGLDIDVILGSSQDVMPALAKQGKKFDVVFIDGEFDEQMEQFDWAVKLTRPGGCVFLDDAMVSVAKELGGKDSLLAKIGRDPRITATLVPTVASHSVLANPLMNGFILARVN